MPALSDRDLQTLLEPPAGTGMFLTFYSGGGPLEERIRDFEARTSDLHRSIHANDESRPELDRNVLAVRRALESEKPPFAAGLVIVGSAGRNFLQVARLDVPVAADLRFERSPASVPLLRALHQRREYLVVQSDTHRARLFAASPGDIVNLLEAEHPVEKKHHSSGERYGYEQNIIGRHRDDHIRHARTDLVEHVVKHWDPERYSGLILLGEHATIRHLRDSLPPRLRDAAAREEAAEWDDHGSEIRKAIHRIATELQPRGQLDQSVRDRIFQGHSVAMGSTAVLEALDQGRIGARGHGCLVLGPDDGDMIGRCTACQTLGAEPLGRCPKCQAPCAPSSLQQELLLAARRRQIDVRFTDDAGELRPYGGVVGLLAK